MSKKSFVSRVTRSVWLAIPIVLLAACGSPGPAPSTLRPTITPIPIVKPTTPPTVTPLPTAAPTVDPHVVATFAPDVNPLTGEKVSDPNVLNRRPLEIVIGNANEVGVRPQSGTSYADWVFEHETEAPDITRWGAIFYGKTPDRVGTDRSCRIIDDELPAIFKSLLACSGMSGGTREFYIKPSDFNQEQRFFSPDFGDGTPMFFRMDIATASWNTLFVNPTEVWKAAEKRGSNIKPDLTVFTFSERSIAAGTPATDIGLTFHSSSVEWKYDSSVKTCSSLGGCYLRWNDGAAHTDALNGQQLSAANVIVVYVNYTPDQRFLEEEYPKYGIKLFGWQIQLWGDPGGNVKIFRDGQEFDGKWSRPTRPDTLSFKDAKGQPIPLKPGNTWVELVRLDANVTVKP